VSVSSHKQRKRGRTVRATERDLSLLGFIAEHRLVLPAQAGRFLGSSTGAADARMRALASEGFLFREALFHREPPYCQATRAGLSLIGSDLPTPKFDVAGYRHDVGVAWLWLAAHRGTFGQLEEVIGERRMRSTDAKRDPLEQPIAVRLGGAGPRGRERLHYPDLLLVEASGRRIALELELTRKGRTRREAILSGYSLDRRIDKVLYLVENRSLGRAISDSARKLGISDRVHVQMVSMQPVGGRATAGRSSQRAHAASRAAELERGAER
jgi:hypothetical protein